MVENPEGRVCLLVLTTSGEAFSPFASSKSKRRKRVVRDMGIKFLFHVESWEIVFCGVCVCVVLLVGEVLDAVGKNAI